MSTIQVQRLDPGLLERYLLEECLPEKQPEITRLQKCTLVAAWAIASFIALFSRGGYIPLNNRLADREISYGSFGNILYKILLNIGSCGGFSCLEFFVAAILIRTNLYPQTAHQKALLESRLPTCRRALFLIISELVGLLTVAPLAALAYTYQSSLPSWVPENEAPISISVCDHLIFTYTTWLLLLEQNLKNSYTEEEKPLRKIQECISQEILAQRARYLDTWGATNNIVYIEEEGKKSLLSLEGDSKNRSSRDFSEEASMVRNSSMSSGAAQSMSTSRSTEEIFQELQTIERLLPEAEKFRKAMRFFLREQEYSACEPATRKHGRVAAKSFGFVCGVSNMVALACILCLAVILVVEDWMNLGEKVALGSGITFAILYFIPTFYKDFSMIPEGAEQLFEKTYDTFIQRKSAPTLANRLRPIMNGIFMFLSSPFYLFSYGPGQLVAEDNFGGNGPIIHVPIPGEFVERFMQITLIAASIFLVFGAVVALTQELVEAVIDWQDREEERDIRSLARKMNQFSYVFANCQVCHVARALRDIDDDLRNKLISKTFPNEDSPERKFLSKDSLDTYIETTFQTVGRAQDSSITRV